jgi:hypothetical protein
MSIGPVVVIDDAAEHRRDLAGRQPDAGGVVGHRLRVGGAEETSRAEPAAGFAQQVAVQPADLAGGLNIGAALRLGELLLEVDAADVTMSSAGRPAVSAWRRSAGTPSAWNTHSRPKRLSASRSTNEWNQRAGSAAAVSSQARSRISAASSAFAPAATPQRWTR